MHVAFDLLLVSCAGLNYLFFDGERCLVPKKPTTLHFSIFRQICGKIDHSLLELLRLERSVSVQGGFDRLLYS